MRAEALKEHLKKRPFAPVRLSLSDGRSVSIRHPDQAVVTPHNLFVGLATIQRGGRMASPASADTIAKEWLFIDLIHVVSVEPVNGEKLSRRRQK